MEEKPFVGRKSQLVVLYQVVTNPCFGLVVIICGFILHLIGCKTVNIPEIFSGVHSFTGKTVTVRSVLFCPLQCLRPEMVSL